MSNPTQKINRFPLPADVAEDWFLNKLLELQELAERLEEIADQIKEEEKRKDEETPARLSEDETEEANRKPSEGRRK